MNLRNTRSLIQFITWPIDVDIIYSWVYVDRIFFQKQLVLFLFRKFVSLFNGAESWLSNATNKMICKNSVSYHEAE